MKRRPLLLAVATLGAACANTHPYRFADRPPCGYADDERPIPAPRPRPALEYTPLVDNTFFDTPKRAISFDRKEAANVNALDEVPDSSWFTNRIGGAYALSSQQIAAGPEEGPPPQPPFLVTGRKAAGASPGFIMSDALGQRWVVKLDPYTGPYMSSTAEVVSTRLAWAMGYNVPEDRVIAIDPVDLHLGAEAGKKPLRQADLDRILATGARLSDGRLRGIASRYLPGELLGPFPMRGTRADDGNDQVPHEDRRELRGLQVLFAWLDNIDNKEANTMDVFIPGPRGHGFVRHYLMDLGDTLGSFVGKPKDWDETEARFDWSVLGHSAITLGAWVAPHERKQTPIAHPEIGRFSANGLRPGRWHGLFYQPPFAAQTARDGYWGAKLVTAFTAADLRAVVARAELPDPAAQGLVDVLVARQRIIGRYWFGKVNPLDGFRMTAAGAGPPGLCFADLASARGILTTEESASTRFTYVVSDADGRPLGEGQLPGGPTGQTCVRDASMEDRVSPNDDGYRVVALTTTREGTQVGNVVRVHLVPDANGDGGDHIIGIER
jgi:hypothetical protein